MQNSLPATLQRRFVMPDVYVSEIDFGDGIVRKIKDASGSSGGITSVSFNGVAQTVSSGSVDIDGASNLITEAQWTQIQSILS